MTMGEKILNMRKARGWSQEELADRVGVTRQAVSRWESGSAKPDADKIISICDLFGVSADYLLRDQYAGEGAVVQPEKHASTAVGEAVRSITLKQWATVGAVALGSLMLFIMKIIHVVADTNYYYSDGRWTYTGFTAFLKIEGLELLWYLALGAVIFGLLYLLIGHFIRKDKDSVGWMFDSD